MRKQKIYLETTLFNFYVDEERGFAHDSTVTLFKEIAAGKYKAFTSAVVIEELAKALPEKYEKMSGLIQEYGISILALTDEADMLADVYVAEEIIPLKYRTDGVHIAIAAVNDLNMIVSMNFQHIVKRKTKLLTEKVNTLHGYRAVEIFNPMEVTESERD